MMIHHMIFQQNMCFFLNILCCHGGIVPLGGGRLSRALLRPLRAMDLAAA